MTAEMDIENKDLKDPQGEGAGDTEMFIDDTSGERDGLMSHQSTDFSKAAGIYEWLRDRYSNARVPYRYRLVAEKDVLEKSMQSVRFTIMCSAINTKMLNPNYPILVTPGADPDSFPDTKPFDFNSATYFLPMCSLLGVAIASIFLGQISDRVGRKKVLLVLAWISAVGSIVKFYASNTFWGFCVAQFAFGFFLGNLPVGMAYVGDIFTNKKDKERELGVLVSYFVMGNSGGGMIAILMNGSGLFSPLWVGAGLLAVAALNTSWNMIEAGDVRLEALVGEVNDEEEDMIRPKVIEKKALWNIIAGAVADNFGSTGLFPLCLSPLAIEHYLLDFTSANPPEEPIMSILGYQWLSVCVAGMVVPSTLMTPYVFRKLGVAGTCVVGNTATAVVTVLLLLIGNAPATNAWFGTFVFVMYASFPFTVFSQLTTGPMLDIIAPIDKIGYVQGLNNAAMNFGMAIAPWLFGILADSTSTNTAIIVGIGISLLAAAINTPLTCDPRFGRAKELPESSQRILTSENRDFAEAALNGDFVDQEQLLAFNLNRLKEGHSFIVPRVKSYKEEKENGLAELHSQARDAYRQRLRVGDRVLSALSDSEIAGSKEELCKMLNASVYSDEEAMNEATHELGIWIGDYLLDAGYNPHTTSAMLKQMVMTALPPINFDGKYTPANIEDSVLRTKKVVEKFAEDDSRSSSSKGWTFSSTLGKGSAAVFYS